MEPVASGPADVLMAEAVHATKSSSSFVITALKRELEAENASGPEATVIHRLAVTLHAALIDAGFLPLGSRLGSLKDWASGASPTLTVKYTLLDLVAALPPQAEEGKILVLNYSLMPNFVLIYGCVPGAKSSEVRRLCLELPKLAPLLHLDSNNAPGSSAPEEDEILELWRVLKGELCLPLTISLCQHNGLSLPPCLMALPGDLIAKVLDFVPGEDLAKVQCTCKELKGLAADNGLWKRKYLELNTPGGGEGSRCDRNWKQWFVIAWTHKVANEKRQLQQQNKRRRPSSLEDYYWTYAPPPPSPHNFLLSSGDYGWTNFPPPPSPPLSVDDLDQLIANHLSYSHGYGDYGWTNFPPPPSPPSYSTNVDDLDQLITNHLSYSWN